jgi:hypothetical protein
VVALPVQVRTPGNWPSSLASTMRFAGCLVVSLSICLGLASPLNAQSAWYLMTDIESGESTTVREVLISGGKVKTLPRDEQEPWLLVDIDSREIVLVDPEQRVYAQATPAAHCAALAESGKTWSDLVPPRFRDDEVLGSAAGNDAEPLVSTSEAIRIREVGTAGQVGEFETVRYDISLGRSKVEEIYLTTDARLLGQLGGLEGVAAYVTVVQELGHCLREVLGEQPSLLSSAGRASLEDRPEYLEILKKGWPVKSSWLGEPTRRDETVTIASEWNVRPTDLDPPASYREVSITDMLFSPVR